MLKPTPSAILFVCLGNICRSPLAEAAFRHEASLAGLDVTADSAGTGDWHVGRPPDPRAQATALRHGIDISTYRARQIGPADFQRFDMNFCAGWGQSRQHPAPRARRASRSSPPVAGHGAGAGRAGRGRPLFWR
ncbi:protein-tyrosine-phosphatase [Sphingobium sp. B11D3D]|nr:protein-tyrosine-phosphatase [Sphingobium sp. B11D3D]